MGRQYGEVFHSCVAFSLSFSLGKYLHTQAIPPGFYLLGGRGGRFPPNTPASSPKFLPIIEINLVRTAAYRENMRTIFMCCFLSPLDYVFLFYLNTIPIWLTLLFIWDYIMPSNLVCMHVVIVPVATPPGSMEKFVIRKATSQGTKRTNGVSLNRLYVMHIWSYNFQL